MIVVVHDALCIVVIGPLIIINYIMHKVHQVRW